MWALRRSRHSVLTTVVVSHRSDHCSWVDGCQTGSLNKAENVIGTAGRSPVLMAAKLSYDEKGVNSKKARTFNYYNW